MVRPNCPSLPAPQEKSWPWSLSATLWDSPQATCTMCCPAKAPICSEENRKPLRSQDSSHSDMQTLGLGKFVCKAIRMGALTPNLVWKHFLQEESTRLYCNHVAAELFWKPGLQIIGERQVHAPKNNDGLHTDSLSDTGKPIRLFRNNQTSQTWSFLTQFWCGDQPGPRSWQNL